MCELLNGNMFPYEFPLIFLSMAAEQEQSPNLLDFNNKQENNGTNNRGRLTAHEFNQLINAVNNNSNDTFSFQKTSR